MPNEGCGLGDLVTLIRSVVADNQVQVDVVAGALPAGAATEVTLAAINAVLNAIDIGIPASVGQAAMAASMPVVIANNQSAVPVSIATAPALVASEAHVGEVGYSKLPVIVTPTITAGAYSADDIIGGIQTLTDAARESDGAVTLDTLVIRDLAIQDADITIWFFNQNPVNGTYTDNIALDIHDTDHGFLVGVLRVLSSDYDDAADNAAATLRNVGLDMTAVGSANLYAIAQILVGDTYVGTSDLTFVYNFSRH